MGDVKGDGGAKSSRWLLFDHRIDLPPGKLKLTQLLPSELRTGPSSEGR